MMLQPTMQRHQHVVHLVAHGPVALPRDVGDQPSTLFGENLLALGPGDAFPRLQAKSLHEGNHRRKDPTRGTLRPSKSNRTPAGSNFPSNERHNVKMRGKSANELRLPSPT